MWDRVLEHFAAYQRAAGLAERTIASRDECLRRFAEHCGREPRQVENYDMLSYLGRPHHRTGRPLSAGTKQVERSYLQTWGKFMLLEGYLAYDPTQRLPKVKVPRRRPRPLRLEHIDLMLDSGAYRNTRDIIAIAALTGLRIGEIVKIRGEDIDWVSGTLRSLRKGSLDWAAPTANAFRAIAERRPREGWWFPSPYVNASFPEGGGHILMKSASTRISIVMRKIGIADRQITAHSLRHFYATTLLRQGVPIRVVQEMMGHASLATTQLYTEVTDDELAAAAAVMPTIDPRARAARASKLVA